MSRYADKVSFEVRWRPYQLQPDAPGGKGVNKLQMYQQKFGKERVEQMLPGMQSVGARHGINFSYGGNVGNTFDSHRLVSLAYKQGGLAKQDELVEELFKNYFEQEKCISDPDVLLAAADKVGLVGTREVLASKDAEALDVHKELDQFKPLAKRGVPQFVFNGRPLPEAGALESDELQREIEKALQNPNGHDGQQGNVCCLF